MAKRMDSAELEVRGPPVPVNQRYYVKYYYTKNTSELNELSLEYCWQSSPVSCEAVRAREPAQLFQLVNIIVILKPYTPFMC